MERIGRILLITHKIIKVGRSLPLRAGLCHNRNVVASSEWYGSSRIHTGRQ
jgi:hypothetical protein